MKSLWAVLLLLAAPSAAGEPRAKAWTRGHFRLRYELAPAADGVKAEELKVSLRNETALPYHPSGRLRDHEDGHRRINEAAVGEIEAALAALPLPKENDRAALKRAEGLLKKEFRRLVAETDDLHAAWDKTHTVP